MQGNGFKVVVGKWRGGDDNLVRGGGEWVHVNDEHV